MDSRAEPLRRTVWAGIGLSFIEGAPVYGIIGFVVSGIGTLASMGLKPKVELELDLALATKLADGRLQEEIALRDKTILELQEKLTREDATPWERAVRGHLEKGDVQSAIDSIDTDESDQ